MRRLLENGANTSFVHALLDERVPVEKVVVDPIAAVEAEPGSHTRIPTPRQMYADRLRCGRGPFAQPQCRHGPPDDEEQASHTGLRMGQDGA